MTGRSGTELAYEGALGPPMIMALPRCRSPRPDVLLSDDSWKLALTFPADARPLRSPEHGPPQQLAAATRRETTRAWLSCSDHKLAGHCRSHAGRRAQSE